VCEFERMGTFVGVYLTKAIMLLNNYFRKCEKIKTFE